MNGRMRIGVAVTMTIAAAVRERKRSRSEDEDYSEGRRERPVDKFIHIKRNVLKTRDGSRANARLLTCGVA